MLLSDDRDLRAAILGSLDDLLRVLAMEEIGDDRFRVDTRRAGLPDRIYGGQLLAHALLGAGATVDGKAPQSLHAGFVRAGAPEGSIEIAVERVSDGRTMATRQILVRQEGRTLLVAFASFHEKRDGPDLAGAAPSAPSPYGTPLLQHWVRELPPHQRDVGRHWVEQPPPLDLRLSEAPTFLGGPASTATARSHWMRLPRSVGEDQLLHAALLAYASDFFLMDMIFRAHPAELGPGTANGFSVDHALWFHRPVRFDVWHLHTQEALAITGERGLARGSIHDGDGRLAATVMQEVVVRPLGSR